MHSSNLRFSFVLARGLPTKNDDIHVLAYSYTVSFVTSILIGSTIELGHYLLTFLDIIYRLVFFPQGNR